MPSLPVTGLPTADAGRMLVRLNHVHRPTIRRYGVAKLTNRANGRSDLVLLLGHDDGDRIFMPYDIRTRLEVTKGGMLDFEIRPVRLLGTLMWYVSSPDPAVRLPAWMTLIGLALAIVGIWLSLGPPSCG